MRPGPDGARAPRAPSWRVAAALLAGSALGVAAPLAMGAGPFEYFRGSLSTNSLSCCFANHTQTYVVQIDNSQANANLQTGMQRPDGSHYAIATGSRIANWGPSGPNGWYGKPRCWRLSGPNPVSVSCNRVTAN
jgi:hypothetical protein